MSRHEETAWSIVSAVAVVAGLVIRIGGGLRIELPRRAALSGGLGLSLDEFHAPIFVPDHCNKFGDFRRCAARTHGP
jgi:hypothetical protein